METKKFVFTINTWPPTRGDTKHVWLLSHELVKRGHEVHIIYSFDASKLKTKESQEVNDDTIFIHPIHSRVGRIDPYIIYLCGTSPFFLNKYKNYIHDIMPDIVHHHNISLLGYSVFKKIQDRYIQIYTAHDYWLICQKYNLLRNTCQFCNNHNKNSCFLCVLRAKRIPQIWRQRNDFLKSIKNIDTIIAPSEFMRNILLKELNLKNINTDLVTIPNFVFPPTEYIKNSGYLNYFLYVGALEINKGVINLLALFKKHRNKINARLIITGKGPCENKIKKYIAKNSLNNVIFLGWVSNEMLWALYADALALVVPSIWPENNPLVALEAMSVGTPVIGTNVGGLREILEKVDKNLIFNGDGLEEIKMILNNRSLYSRKRIKEIYNRWYSPERYLRQYEKLLKQA